MSWCEEDEPFGVAFAFVFSFFVSCAAEDWGLGPAQNLPAHVGEGVSYTLGDGLGECWVEDHAGLEFLFGGFVVGFDEGDDLACVFEPCSCGGEGAVLFGPAEVHDDEIDAALVGD